jgi:hypothetical protein
MSKRILAGVVPKNSTRRAWACADVLVGGLIGLTLM